jgi:two-component system sensor histidine kinase KdpD
VRVVEFTRAERGRGAAAKPASKGFGPIHRSGLLTPGRLAVGWAAAVVLPVVVTAAFVLVGRSVVSLGIALIVSMAVVVLVALVGGLLPAVVAAMLGSALLNWFFTPPYGSLAIESPEDAVVLVLFLAVGCAVAWIVDLAARRARQAQETAQQAAGLAAGNAMRTALLAAVSHDLRTPLAAIKASVSSLRLTDIVLEPNDEAILLETIEESADRLDALIANLLDMSRLQAGSLEDSRDRPMDVGAVILSAVDSVVRGQDAPPVALEVAADLPLARGDSGFAERIVANLIENAVRYGGEGGVLVSGSSVGDRVEVRVIDHGPGVRDDDKDAMFTPFQRLGDSHGGAAAGSGVGLGLAVARGFAEVVGGTLEAEDTPGGGLTMVLSLQRAAQAGASDDERAGIR